MVRYLYQHHALPVQRPGDFPAGQEGSEPPLYYALGAALFSVSPQPTIALNDHRNQNPYVNFSRLAEPRDNRNLYAHPVQEQFPYRGDVLGVHLVRLLGIVLGCLTVIFTFLAARELFPERRFLPLLAASIVAFDPQFAFLSGVVNDDDGIAAAASLVLWLLLRWIRRGGSVRLALCLGVGLGVAVLMKVSGLLLVPLAALALVGEAAVLSIECSLPWNRSGRGLPRAGAEQGNRPVAVSLEVIVRRSIRPAAIVAVPFLAVAGWWLARNQILYGDPLGWSMMLAANWEMIRPNPISFPAAVRSLWQARGTYWGMFGWTNVAYPEQVYRLIDLAIGIAVVGLLIALVRGARSDARWRRWFAVAIVVVWPLVVFASLVHWLQINRAADQWRLLFPAVAAIGILLALGIEEIVRLPIRLGDVIAAGSPRVGARHASPLPLALAGSLAVVGVALNVLVVRNEIIATYVPRFEAASTQTPIARFGNQLDLLNARLDSTRLEPGQPLGVTVRWRTPALLEKNWSVSVTLVGPDGQVLASGRGWPQGGRAPTTAWPPGKVVPDQYHLTPHWSSTVPESAAVWLGVYDGTVAGGPSLPVVDAQGRALGAGLRLGTVVLRPTTRPSVRPEQAVHVQFADGIQLDGYTLAEANGTSSVTLFWRATAQPAQSYTVFVHLANAQGKVIAQQDGLPLGGTSPTTIWQAGDLIPDPHSIALKSVPPGSYHVWVGLYRPETGQRLGVLRAGSLPVDHDSLDLTTIAVTGK